MKSPDGRINVGLQIKDDGELFYGVSFNGQAVLKPSSLGLVREDGDFTRGLHFVSATGAEVITDRYQMFNAKKKNIVYVANKRTYRFTNNKKQEIDIIFQASNDGVAFRYFFPGTSVDKKMILEEATSFQFDTSVRAWLQPMQISKSGWEQTNPAYEEHYKQAVTSDSASTYGAGWVFPALFKTGTSWVLLTEGSLDSSYCASRLRPEATGGRYRIGFPDPKEKMPNEGLLPLSKLPFSSPWRIITIGSLKTLAESTLGTDLAQPAHKMDVSFIKPGKASWSWINSKDDFIVYDEQLKYIDFAAKMNWQYCLIDVNWDRKIGYEKIKELAAYAAKKNVGLFLWYNSAGSWNTVKYTPKDMLLTHADRMKEFSRLKDMGIKGIKIDFFAGDGQSVINYYIQILKDAAAYQLMINFHGATLPRGWHRTYPNLMTAEAVRGFEMITFNQADANREAVLCATLPFTRNAYDPMDFTPMNLHKINTRVKRKTSSGFELALSVLFLSGIQHFAESPEGMLNVPEEVQAFLRTVPAQWDDVKFIDGFPGKYVVIGRKAGNKWYVAGINAEGTEKIVHIDASALGKKSARLITDGNEELSFLTRTETLSKSMNIAMKPNGGFVLIIE
ncbi:MAG TPA: glycoside hydrolase family 97 catalytic domain-containing protein [Chitinophagaceae bacterium]|nr:glycoside hydrolase family 97 catalytic domain-containing protein [Chitinophagaceae bacterium]